MEDDRIAKARALAEEGKTLFRAWRFEEAEARLLASVRLAISFPALHNIGAIRELYGDYEGAEAWFRRALELEPQSPRGRASLGLVLLGQGRFAEGFPYYDAWREVAEFRDKVAPRREVPLWNGEPTAGKALLVWPEEGFGDQIMFARFTPLLREAGTRIAWYCNPAIMRLLAEGLGVEAVPTGAKGAFRHLDYIVPSSRLPVVFVPRLGAPPSEPYLPLPPANVIEGLTLGIVTRGNPGHPNDRNRSLPPEAAAQLMALPGAVSLAPQDTGARDFYDTATVIAGLDLVITVDSAVAHLAGAMGKPVWVLLPAIGADWRWMRERADTPWYPTMRLFRQTTPGDWWPVLDEVKAALAQRR